MANMKKTIATVTVLALTLASLQTAPAGDREWATVGKLLTGIAAGVVLANALDYPPAPCPVPVVCTPPRIMHAPAPVVYVPAPVVVHPRPVFITLRPLANVNYAYDRGQQGRNRSHGDHR